MSNLLLFANGTPDLMMAGAAIFAMLCGIVLMGGRSVVGGPLRALTSFLGWSMRREGVACMRVPSVDRGPDQGVRDLYSARCGTWREARHFMSQACNHWVWLGLSARNVVE